MSTDIQDLFKEREYCLAELARIRAMWGSKQSTAKHFAAARNTLAYMALYCPADLQTLVESTMDELSTREAYLPGGALQLLHALKQALAA